MPMSSRTFMVGAGAVLLAAAGLGRSLAQQQDGNVRAAHNQSAAMPKGIPAIIGTVDLDAIFEGYDKSRFTNEEVKTAAMATEAELKKLEAKVVEANEKLGKMAPGTETYKKIDNEATQLKVQLQAQMEQAQKEFEIRQSNALSTIYKEISVMVARVAQARGMTYVVRIKNVEPPMGSPPNLIAPYISRQVVYSDPRCDITKDVLYYLNKDYKLKGGQAPKLRPAK